MSSVTEILSSGFPMIQSGPIQTGLINHKNGYGFEISDLENRWIALSV